MSDKRKWTTLNKHVFEELSNIYTGITIKEIVKAEQTIKDFKLKVFTYGYGEAIAGYLTGFCTESCLLCVAIKYYCDKCYWKAIKDNGCNSNGAHETFQAITNAKDKHELKLAMNNRGFYMKNLY